MIIFELLFKSAVDSFLQVGVFVSIVLFSFGFINSKYDNIFLRFLINNKKFQLLIGALLGLSPGCGGAILVMPLFVKGHISFGTVIATLIATMGDSAFVISLVFASYFIYELVVYFIGGEDILTISVFGGAIIELTPGCGPQIIFVTLYTKVIIPFGALISNAISQDGDILFPLIAMDKKDFATLSNNLS